MKFKHVQMKRRRTLSRIVPIFFLCFCLPGMAQERDVWEFDSLRANSSVSKPDDQQIHEVLLKMLDRWNAHDIEGYLEVYWKSPELFVVVDSEQFNGCSNFMIPTLTAIRIAMRWGSFNPNASR
jgi:hypothetical protein